MPSAIFRGAFVSWCLGTFVSHAATVSQSSTAWTALAGNYDYFADQQTGQPESDIVGTATNTGFFTTLNDNGSASNVDGTLGFRLRLDQPGGTVANPAFTRVAWVGIDANQDAVLDVFVGLGLQGSTSVLGIYDAGNSANTGPSTTSISSTAYRTYTVDASTFNYRAVNFTTDGGTTNDVTTTTTGDADYYVSFMVNFGDLVTFLQTQGITITDASPLRYVLATSTQHNSLNQDLGGVQGGINSTQTWVQLGGYSQLVTASGSLIPEPSGALLGLLSLGTLALRRKR
jgi:hypothetical protein